MEKPKIQWSCKRNKSSQHVGATQVELARAVHGLPLKNQLVKAECDVSNHNVFHIGHGKGAGDKHNMLPSFPYVWATGCKTFSKAISCRELCDFFHVSSPHKCENIHQAQQKAKCAQKMFGLATPPHAGTRIFHEPYITCLAELTIPGTKQFIFLRVASNLLGRS